MNPAEIEIFKKKFDGWIDSIISYDESKGLKNDFRTKIDLLERAIQLVRFHVGENENQLNYSDFLQLNISFGSDKIIFLPFSDPDSQNLYNVLVEPHKPSEFQIPLALHLLVNHGKNKPVYDIIDSFISDIKPYLNPLDFDKTQTGVIRCFTNTRFAASGLRDQGLLKFTRKEAFRTWELSFVGILAAGFLYYENWRDLNQDDYRFDPWRTIDNAIQLLANLPKDDFVKTLALLCDHAKNDDELLSSYGDKLKSIHPMIRRYSLMVREEKEGLQKRKRIAEVVAEIERIPMIDKFVRDFRVEHEMVDFNRRVRNFLQKRNR